MRRRLLVAAPLTAGLLAAAACGGHPAGHARPALRPAKAAFLSGVSATSGGATVNAPSFQVNVVQ